MKTRTLCAALLLSGLCAVAQAGDIYKWVDAKGSFHYSDLPQAGWTRVGDRPGTASATIGDDADSNGDERVQALARATDCARKEEQLKTYRNAMRIVERDSLGGEKEYSNEEREKLIAQTEQAIASGCTEQPLR